MVNQEKVRLMTRAECYRQREKRGALRINRYNKGAYVSQQVVKALIICTAGVVVGALMWIFYVSEELLGSNDLGLVGDVLKQIALLYGAALVTGALIAWRRYSHIFMKARGSVKRYYNMLRRVNHCNEKAKRGLTGELPSVRKEGERR